MSEPALQHWHEFYFLLGTSAAALTGLMAVVVSINPDTIAERSAVLHPLPSASWDWASSGPSRILSSLSSGSHS